MAVLRHWPGIAGRRRFNAGRVLKNGRQQIDERRTAVIGLWLSTRTRLCPISWSSPGWRRKPLIAKLEVMCFGLPPDRQRNCHRGLKGVGGRSREGGAFEFAVGCETQGGAGGWISALIPWPLGRATGRDSRSLAGPGPSSGQIFRGGMAKTCRNRPGNLTRSTDG